MLHLKTGEKTYVTTPFVWITKLKKKKPVCYCILSNGQLLILLLWAPESSFRISVVSILYKIFPFIACKAHITVLQPCWLPFCPWKVPEYSCLWVFALVISAGNFFQWKLCWQIPPHSSGIFTNVAVYIRTSSTSLFSNFSLPQNSLPFLPALIFST